MPDVLTRKKLTKQTIGANSNTWGTILNDTIQRADDALAGELAKEISGDTVLTATEARNFSYRITSAGDLTDNAIITFPLYYGFLAIENATTGGQALIAGMAGETVAVAPATKIIVVSDGVDFIEVRGNPSGSVVCYPPPNLRHQHDSTVGGIAWLVIGPNGEMISTAGTTTGGLQEAIDYAVGGGFPLRVRARGIADTVVALDDLTYPPIFYCTTGITIPASQIADLDFGNASIIFSAAVTGFGVTIDSFEMMQLRFGGQIGYQGGQAAVCFRPTLPVPLDALTAMTSSRLRFGSVAIITGGGTNSAVVLFDLDGGSVAGASFEFAEILANNVADFGIQILNAGSVAGSTVFEQNEIRCANIHGFNNCGVIIGGNPVAGFLYGANYRGNIWHLAGLRGGNAAAVGISTVGNNDTFIGGAITSQEGGLDRGIIIVGNDTEEGSPGPGGNSNTFLGFSTLGNTGVEFEDSGRDNFAIVNGHLWLGGVPLDSGVLTSVSGASTTTLTAAAMTGYPSRQGVISRSGGADVSDTTDTATNLLDALTGSRGQIGSRFQLKIMNGRSGTLTITGGTGVSILGIATIAAGESHDFVGIIDSADPPHVNLCG